MRRERVGESWFRQGFLVEMVIALRFEGDLAFIREKDEVDESVLGLRKIRGRKPHGSDKERREPGCVMGLW